MESKTTPGVLSRIKNVFYPEKQVEPKAQYTDTGSNRGHVMTFSYTGEKNLGEMGPAIDYRIDYDILRVRSWQSQIESDVCKTVIGRFVTWTIGTGLKLQSEPDEAALKSESITIDKQAFSELAEARFGVFKRSKISDYSGMNNIDRLAKKAKKNAIIGGDVLVILRYNGKNVNAQLIDGCHVQSPMYGSEFWPQVLTNGNVIKNGVEINPEGQHVAYYVRIYDGNGILIKYDRILARSKKLGLQTAFLVYGSEHRLDNVRGLPLLAACLETAKKLERYKEATLGSAEEIAKIVYQVVHQAYSTGESPLGNRLAQASGFEPDKPEISTDSLGQKVASDVAATTNKQAINMPVGSELKTVDNTGALTFKEFYEVNADLLCATVGIPPNVAFQKYNDSFSASRAAIKDWEHSLIVDRDDFAFQYYQPIYEFWLELEIMSSKINAFGYLPAKLNDNYMVLGAYRKTRWVGSQVPHIDPVKEVMAERLKLGTSAAAIPLTTVEASTENLASGESDANMLQYSKEYQYAKDLGIELAVPVISPQKKDKEEE